MAQVSLAVFGHSLEAGRKTVDSAQLRMVEFSNKFTGTAMRGELQPISQEFSLARISYVSGGLEQRIIINSLKALIDDGLKVNIVKQQVESWNWLLLAQIGNRTYLKATEVSDENILAIGEHSVINRMADQLICSNSEKSEDDLFITDQAIWLRGHFRFSPSVLTNMDGWMAKAIKKIKKEHSLQVSNIRTGYAKLTDQIAVAIDDSVFMILTQGSSGHIEIVGEKNLASQILALLKKENPQGLFLTDL